MLVNSPRNGKNHLTYFCTGTESTPHAAILNTVLSKLFSFRNLVRMARVFLEAETGDNGLDLDGSLCLSTDSRSWTNAMGIPEWTRDPSCHTTAVKNEKKKNPTVLNSIARYTLVNHSPFNAVQKTAMRCSEVRTNLAFAEARLLRRLGNVTALQCLKWFQRRTRYAAFF